MGEQLVQVARGHLQGSELARGIVVGVSEQLLVIHKLSDCITLDGFEVLRIRDITSVSTDFRRKGFYEKALRMKGIKAQSLHAGIISDMAQAVVSFSRAYPLLVLSRERIDPESVWIGRVTDVKPSGVRVQLIDTSAELLEAQEFYRFDSITRFEFGGEYEETLALVAGLRQAIRGSRAGVVEARDGHRHCLQSADPIGPAKCTRARLLCLLEIPLLISSFHPSPSVVIFVNHCRGLI